MAALKAGLSMTDSPRALMTKVKSLGSFTQDGSGPQRTSANCRLPSIRQTIAIGCVGATCTAEENWAVRDSRTAPGSPLERKSPHNGHTLPNLACHKAI